MANLTTLADDTTEVVFLGFTRGELSAAFDRVADPANWKNPIRATIDLVIETVSIPAIDAACMFFAGCHIAIRQTGPTTVEVTAARLLRGGRGLTKNPARAESQPDSARVTRAYDTINRGPGERRR